MKVAAKVYLHGSKESNHDDGVKRGLTGEALRTFLFTCYEVAVDIEVDTDTGESTIVAVDGRPLGEKA